MKYNILSYISFILLIIGVVLFFSGSKYGTLSVFILLSSALLGSLSLYFIDRKRNVRKNSASRMASLVSIVMPITATVLLIVYGLMWMSYPR